MRIALLQQPPGPANVAANIARLAEVAALASRSGAELLICPEMFLTGYSIGKATVRELAESADGPSFSSIARIAVANNTAIVYGYPELDGKSIYNSCNVVDRDGKLLASYRKTHLFGNLDHSLFEPGTAMPPVVSYRGWNVAVLICYDLEFPEMARALAVAGADLICVPTANMIEFDVVPTVLVPARAYENQLYVAYANYCGQDDRYVYGGLSMTAGPDGRPLVQAARTDSLLICDLDEPNLRASRTTNPYLPNRRRDLY